MRGYLSFVLVFICLALSLSLFGADAYRHDLSKAISVERAYGVQMNAKETVFEAVRQGGAEGFAIYSSTHLPQMCYHCPDHLCIIYPIPLPNSCDPALCSFCFREDESRGFAEFGAARKLGELAPDSFDQDFSVESGPSALEAFLAPDPLSPGRYRLGSMRFRGPMRIHVGSKKLNISTDSEIPEGTIVGCD